MIQWRLRQVMAVREIWTGKRLMELMESKAGVRLSHPSVMQLVNEKPKQVRLTTLEALCVALDCSPWDILQWSPSEALEAARERLNGEPVRLMTSPTKQPVLYPEEDF